MLVTCVAGELVGRTLDSTGHRCIDKYGKERHLCKDGSAGVRHGRKLELTPHAYDSHLETVQAEAVGFRCFERTRRTETCALVSHFHEKPVGIALEPDDDSGGRAFDSAGDSLLRYPVDGKFHLLRNVPPFPAVERKASRHSR